MLLLKEGDLEYPQVKTLLRFCKWLKWVHVSGVNGHAAHLAQKNPFFSSFRNTINLCAFHQKHTLTPYQFLQWGWGKNIVVFIFMIANLMLVWNHSKSYTTSRDWGQLTNRKVGAYNDKLPLGCRRFCSWKGSAMLVQSRPARGFTCGNRIIDSETWSGKPEPGISYLVSWIGCRSGADGTCWQRSSRRVNSQTRHGPDYIGNSCNDSDMEEILVKENVCWIVAAVTLVSHSKTGTMKIWR